MYLSICNHRGRAQACVLCSCIGGAGSPYPDAGCEVGSLLAPRCIFQSHLLHCIITHYTFLLTTTRLFGNINFISHDKLLAASSLNRLRVGVQAPAASLSRFLRWLYWRDKKCLPSHLKARPCSGSRMVKTLLFHSRDSGFKSRSEFHGRSYGYTSGLAHRRAEFDSQCVHQLDTNTKLLYYW